MGSIQGRTVQFRRLIARNSDLLVAAGMAASAVYFFSGRFTTVRFDRERIEIQVEGQAIHVKGLYHYTNTSILPAVLNLRIPFPIDLDHSPPLGFALYESSAEGHALAELPAVERGEVAYLRLVFLPGEAKWIRLDYIQPTRVAEGRYLLTTTRAWGRPISQADFVLRLADHLTLASSNFPVHTIPADGTGKAYAFSRRNFYPDQDWIFTWTAAPVESARATGGQP